MVLQKNNWDFQYALYDFEARGKQIPRQGGPTNFGPQSQYTQLNEGLGKQTDYVVQESYIPTPQVIEESSIPTTQAYEECYIPTFQTYEECYIPTNSSFAGLSDAKGSSSQKVYIVMLIVMVLIIIAI